MKKTLLAVALTAASMTAIADVTISGHANYKAGLLEDFNGNEDLTIGDANTSQSRFRIKSTIDAGTVTYAHNFEFGYTKGGIGTRVNEVTVSGAFGKVSMGNGSSAGDGASENDFSGTYLLAGDLSSWEFGDSTPAAAAGGSFVDADNDPTTAPVFVASAATARVAGLADNNSKDIGRLERVLYTAPAIGDLHLSASINDSTTNDTGNDIAVSATYKLPSFAVSVASLSAEKDDNDVMTASIAGKMANFTASLQFYGSENDTANNDLEQTRVIIGYNPGPFSVSVDFQQTETENKSVEAETAGLNFVYRPTKGVELYAGARNAQAADGAIDENAFLLGARVKF